jgi:hypothetical protein
MRALAILVLMSLPSVVLAQTPALRNGIRMEVGWSDNHRGHDRSPGGRFAPLAGWTGAASSPC